MTNKLYTLSFGLVTMAFSVFSYGESALRVACYDDNEGAKIYVNNKLRGNCPIDIFVPGGEIQLKAVKPVDRDHSRFFETSFYLPDDSAKSIEVLLSAPQITQAGAERRENERLARIRNEASEALTQARAGDTSAMEKMATYYTSGHGVAVDHKKAAYWKDKRKEALNERHAKKLLSLATNNDPASIEELAELYRNGIGVKRDISEAEKWEQKLVYAVRNLAEQGDIIAMRKLASLYEQGKGTEQNNTMAEEWLTKAQLAEKAEQERLAKIEKDNETRQEIEDISYMSATDAIMSDDGLMDSENPLEISSTLVISSLAIITDIVIAPFKMSTYIKLQQDLSARPAEWNNPDSMVAKAYRQQQQKAQDSTVVASAN